MKGFSDCCHYEEGYEDGYDDGRKKTGGPTLLLAAAALLYRDRPDMAEVALAIHEDVRVFGAERLADAWAKLEERQAQLYREAVAA